jgi:DUF4097 and DUF4098 domain-containing protein YvlB
MRKESFAVSGPLSLLVHVPAGEVRIEAVETTEATVELDPLRSSSAEAVDEARVAFRDRPEKPELVVEVDQQPGFRLIRRGASVRVSVRVPVGSDVEVVTASADISARGRVGRGEVKTASGDMSFGEIDGDAQLKSVSGDVEIDRVGGEASVQTVSGDVSVGCFEGPATVNSVSGDVEVREARASVRLQTVSGDGNVASASEGQMTMQSVSGDLKLGVRPGSKIYIDARSTSGETSSELAVGEEPSKKEGPLVELRAKSVSGDIKIVRA